MLVLLAFMANIVLSFSHLETTTLFEQKVSLYSSNVRESSCDNILPGLSFLQRGVDITRLDPFPNSIDGKDGFGDNIIEFTCKKQHRTTLSGRHYEVPDQFSSVKQSLFNPDQLSSASINHFDSYAKFKDHLSKSLGNVDSIPKGWFSETQSLSQYHKMYLNSSSYLFLMEVDIPLYSASLPTRGAIRRFLSDFFTDYLNNELATRYEDDPERYFDFFKSYGTHYFKSATIGGSIKFLAEVDKPLKKNRTMEEFSQNLKSTFVRTLQGKKWNTTALPISNLTHVKIIGGDEEVFESEGFSSWYEKLNERPVIIKGRLEPITTLIRDETKRNNIQKALDVYVGMSYLEESKRALSSYLIVLPRKVKESIELLMKKIEDLQQQDVPTLSDIQKIVNQL